MAIIAINDAQAWVGPSVDDAGVFEGCVNAANAAVIGFLCYDPESQLWAERLNGNWSSILPVNHAPITALTSVEQLLTPGNWLTLDITQLDFDPHSIISYGCRFARGVRNLRATYTAGYLPTDPQWQAMQQAGYMTCSAMWSGRQVDQNATGENFSGVLSQQFWPTGPGAIPPQARSLLQPYKSYFQV